MTFRGRVFDLVVLPTLRRISESRFASAFESMAASYLDMYTGFTYDFDLNGESKLIEACVARSRRSGGSFCFFDAGANQGYWTAAVLAALQGDLTANGYVFDVSAQMVGFLRQRFNGVPQLSIVHSALSDSEGNVEFKHFTEAEHLNTLVVDEQFHSRMSEVEVAPAITGDSYCHANGIEHIDVLKIDTEGWEWHVIQGFSSMISDHKVGVIQFEYGYLSGDSGFLMKDFFDFFNQLGYLVGPLRKDGVAFRDFEYSDNDFKSGPNYVAALPDFVSDLTEFGA